MPRQLYACNFSKNRALSLRDFAIPPVSTHSNTEREQREMQTERERSWQEAPHSTVAVDFWAKRKKNNTKLTKKKNLIWGFNYISETSLPICPAAAEKTSLRLHLLTGFDLKIQIQSLFLTKGL